MSSNLNPSNFKNEREALWKRNDPAEVRDWIKESIDETSTRHQLYRICGMDLDADVVKAAPLIATLSDTSESIFGLSFMWRFLLSRHAFAAAWKVSAALKQAREPWTARLWRLKDLFLWRLAVGIVAGFLLLSSSSLLQDILARAQEHHGWLVSLPLIAVLIIFAHTFAYVLGAAGSGLRDALSRAAIVTLIGSIYAGIGGLLIFRGAGNLGLCTTSRLMVLSSAAALLLGFVFHLF